MLLQGTTAKLYLNRELVAVKLNCIVPPEVKRSSNYIGRSNWARDGYADALIDDIAIYSRALNESEIEALFFDGDGSEILFTENFGKPALHSWLKGTSTGTFINSPGKRITGTLSPEELSVTQACGCGLQLYSFGKSTCAASCYDRYTSKLSLMLPDTEYITSISFNEMEIGSNWGSKGEIIIDGSTLEGFDFGRKPANDKNSDTICRQHSIFIGKRIKKVEFVVSDITSAGEILFDDIIVRYKKAEQVKEEPKPENNPQKPKQEIVKPEPGKEKPKPETPEEPPTEANPNPIINEPVTTTGNIAFSCTKTNPTGTYTSNGTITARASTLANGEYRFRITDNNNKKDSCTIVLGISDAFIPASKGLAKLYLEKADFAPGEKIKLKYKVSGLLISKDAWVGIIPSNIMHGMEELNDQHDIAYKYLGGKSGGEIIFSAPWKEGEYDFRLNNTNNNGIELGTISFQVLKQKADLCSFRYFNITHKTTQPSSPEIPDGTIEFSINKLTEGDFTLQLIDEKGQGRTCTQSLTTPLQVKCNGKNPTVTNASDGSAEVTISGGRKPFTINWNNEATAPRITDLEYGKYSVKVTDALQSSDSCNVTLIIPTSKPDNTRALLSDLVDSIFDTTGCQKRTTRFFHCWKRSNWHGDGFLQLLDSLGSKRLVN